MHLARIDGVALHVNDVEEALEIRAHEMFRKEGAVVAIMSHKYRVRLLSLAHLWHDHDLIVSFNFYCAIRTRGFALLMCLIEKVQCCDKEKEENNGIGNGRKCWMQKIGNEAHGKAHQYVR